MCECDEAFTYKRNLTLHKRLHAEEESSMECLDYAEYYRKHIKGKKSIGRGSAIEEWLDNYYTSCQPQYLYNVESCDKKLWHIMAKKNMKTFYIVYLCECAEKIYRISQNLV